MAGIGTGFSDVVDPRRGDVGGLLSEVPPQEDGFTKDPILSNDSLIYGPRGDSWDECTYWFYSVPGAYYQLGSLFLYLSFMGGGGGEVSAIYKHVTGAIAFTAFFVWGFINICAPDVVAWSVVIVILNIIQVIILISRGKKITALMDKEGMNNVFTSRFSPFDVSPQLFMDLVTCKGCETGQLEKGQVYATEKKTPVDKLSLLISGRMRVHCNGKFLQFITPNAFIDSPEWDSVGHSGSMKSIYKVTITADSGCKFISWKRKGLMTLLSKQKELGKMMNFMIGKDVTDKLYCLNDRCITERGFRYDIRLPCVMSLPEDVERRKRVAEAASASNPASPDVEGRRKHKRLGKTAAAKYANVLATKLRARISLRQQRPVVHRREPLKETD